MAFVNDIRTHNMGLTERFSVMFKKAIERFEQYKLYRSTIVELSSLSNRDLADLGIHRSMISSIARNAAYEE